MKKNYDADYIKEDKSVQQTVNGISRFLILWIIREQGPIHGYRLLQELNDFFSILIGWGTIRKSSPSRVYPMLRRMENNGLIKGDTIVQDNKNVTYYEITDNGRHLLDYIQHCYIITKNTPYGQELSKYLNEE